MKQLLLIPVLAFFSQAAFAGALALPQANSCLMPFTRIEFLQGCVNDIECPAGERCVDGSCRAPMQCFNDFECGPGHRCIGGRCF
ncbi:MAG: hypothetical protein ACXVBE_04690 [Bdellovibrionota bacterium]